MIRSGNRAKTLAALRELEETTTGFLAALRISIGEVQDLALPEQMISDRHEQRMAKYMSLAATRGIMATAPTNVSSGGHQA